MVEKAESSKIKQLVREKIGGDDGKLTWMYNSKTDPEDYLLGKRVDKTYERENELQKEAAATMVGALFDDDVLTHNVKVDMQVKMREDPLFAIRKREEEARRALLMNPVKMKQLQQLVHKKEADDDSKKKKKKKKHRHRSGDDSGDDLLNQYITLLGRGDVKGASGKQEVEPGRRQADVMPRGELRQEYAAAARGSGSSCTKDATEHRHKDINLPKVERQGHPSHKEKKKRKQKHRSRSSSSSSSSSGEELLHKYMALIQGKQQQSGDQGTAGGGEQRQQASSPGNSGDEENPPRQRGGGRGGGARGGRGQQSFRGRGASRGRPPLQLASRPRGDRKQDNASESRTDYHQRSERRTQSSSSPESSHRSERQTQRLLSTERDQRSYREKQDTAVRDTAPHSDRNYSRGTGRQQLTEEEKEARRREMMDNAKWQEEERKKNLKKHEEEAKKEAELRDKGPKSASGFLNPLMAQHAEQSSVEDRLKRNKHHIQRTNAALDKNFALR